MTATPATDLTDTLVVRLCQGDDERALFPFRGPVLLAVPDGQDVRGLIRWLRAKDRYTVQSPWPDPELLAGTILTMSERTGIEDVVISGFPDDAYEAIHAFISPSVGNG